MKRIYLTFILSVLGIWAFAQANASGVEVKKGALNEHKYGDRIFAHQPLGTDGPNYYFLATGAPNAYAHDIVDYKEGDILVRLSEDIRTKYVPIELEEGKKKSTVEFAVMIKGEIYVFYSFQNTKEKKCLLSFRKYNKTSLLPEGKSQLAVEVDYSAVDKFKMAAYDYRLSPDSSNLLIKAGLYDKDGELLKFEFLVLDKDMQIAKSTQNFRSKMPAGVMGFADFGVSNKGDIFLLGMRFDSKKEMRYASKVKRQSLSKYRLISYPVYDFVLLCFMGDNNKDQAITFDLPKHFIRDLQMMLGGDTIMLAGLYSLEGTMSVLGTCLIKYDVMANTLISKETYPFSLDLIIEGTSDKVQAKIKTEHRARRDFETYSYDLAPLLPDGKGGFWLLAEQSRYEFVTQRTGNIVTTNQLYTKENVYVVKYQADGSVAYAGKLIKHQQLMNSGNNWISFKAHANRDHLYLVYNMITGKETGFVKAFTDFSTQITVFNPSGNQESRKLSTSKQLEVDLTPRFAGSWGQNAMVIFGPGKNMSQHRFIKLNF